MSLIEQFCPKHAPPNYQRARRPYWCPECYAVAPDDDPRHPTAARTQADTIDRLTAAIEDALGRHQVTHIHAALRKALAGDDMIRTPTHKGPNNGNH